MTILVGSTSLSLSLSLSPSFPLLDRPRAAAPFKFYPRLIVLVVVCQGNPVRVERIRVPGRERGRERERERTCPTEPWRDATRRGETRRPTRQRGLGPGPGPNDKFSGTETSNGKKRSRHADWPPGPVTYYILKRQKRKARLIMGDNTGCPRTWNAPNIGAFWRKPVCKHRVTATSCQSWARPPSKPSSR